jgi:hypothetical protein
MKKIQWIEEREIKTSKCGQFCDPLCGEKYNRVCNAGKYGKVKLVHQHGFLRTEWCKQQEVPTNAT